MGFIKIKTKEDEFSHLPDVLANYATACGLDGDDNDEHSYQETTGESIVVTCPQCIALWDMLRSVKPKYIER